MADSFVVNHNFISPIEDAQQPTIVGPDEWNDSLAYAGVLGIEFGGTGNQLGHQFGASTTFITQQSDFPVQDATIITLSTGCYIIAAPLTLTKRFVIEDNAAVSFRTSCVLTDILFYTGSGTLFTGSPVILFLQEFVTAGDESLTSFNSQATLFDLTRSSAGLASLILIRASFQSWKDYGTLDDLDLLFAADSNFVDFKAGLKLINGVEEVTIGNCRVSNLESGVAANDSCFNVNSGTYNIFELKGTLYSPLTGDSLIYIDSSVTANVGNIVGCTFSSANGGTFLGAGSVDQTDIHWNFQDNGEATDSQTLGEFSMNSNATETVIVAQNTPVKIAGTTVSGNVERFTHTNGRLTYVGLNTFVGKIFAFGSALVTAENEGDDYTVYIFRNGLLQSPTQMTQTFGSALNAPSISMTPTCLITLVTGDFIEVFVENNTVSNENVLFTSLRLMVFK